MSICKFFSDSQQKDFETNSTYRVLYKSKITQEHKSTSRTYCGGIPFIQTRSKIFIDSHAHYYMSFPQDFEFIFSAHAWKFKFLLYICNAWKEKGKLEDFFMGSDI